MARRNNRNDGVAACRWTPCLNYPELLPLRDALEENITRAGAVSSVITMTHRTGQGISNAEHSLYVKDGLQF